MAAQYGFDRSRLVYELEVRQEPKQARMCGVGGKADRRPIDPPPIVQLRVIHPALQSGNSVAGPSKTRRDNSAGSDSASPDPSPFADGVADDSTYPQSYLQNPYYFMFACLARPDDETELHWLKDGRTRCTTGSVVSSLYHLKDPQNNNEDAGFFVFPDLSVRTEGSYRLKLSLFEVVGNNVHHCKSIYSAPFYVYTAKKFPGMEESTPLSCSLADQGIKIRIRKDIRVRKRQIPALSHPLSTDFDGPDSDGEEEEDPDRRSTRQTKRSRIDNSADAGGSGLSGVRAVQQQLPWPPAGSIHPANIPPSAAPSNSLPSSSSSGVLIPVTQRSKELPPANDMAMSVHLPPGNSLPGPSVYDGRGGGIIQMDPPPQPTLIHQSPQTNNSAIQYRESTQVDGAASSSPQLSTSSRQSHPQYPAPPSPDEAPPAAPPQQQALQPQHQPSHTLTNANGPPQSVAPPPSAHQPPPAMQHQPQPQHPQHMQHQHMQHPQAGAYAPTPYSQWGPTAPAQPSVYDPYYHHQQHSHYATYAPPPQQPLPPPPARYDYGTGMYTHSPAPPPPPPAMPGYGYYDQHQQHHQPPHTHPQQQMLPPHPHSYSQHQVHAPPPMHQYAPPPPAPAPTNTPPAGGTAASMVADAAQIGNGTNSSTPTQPPPNFVSGSGVAAASPQTPVTQYDYGAVYNNRPPVESAAGRGGYGAPTPGPGPGPGQYSMSPMHPTPISAPVPHHHAAHPQGYPMHSAGGAPHHPTPMRHSSYGPPPPHPHVPHHHPAYPYTTYSAPPPPAPEWGGQGFVTNHQHGWDAYAHHQQQQHPQTHLPVGQPQSHSPVGASSATMVNAGAVDQAHRIQLAPIPTDNNVNHGNGTNNASPSMQHSPVRSSSNSSPPTMRSSNNGRRVSMSNSVGERADDGVHGYRNVHGKKNPLSIGSIISNDAR